MRTPLRLLSFPELKSLKGVRYSRSHLKRLENSGLFPKRVHPSEGGQAVAWIEDEIDQHIAERAGARQVEEKEIA
jgi:predicted DNA-binding transcriptional regulator AlpA